MISRRDNYIAYELNLIAATLTHFEKVISKDDLKNPNINQALVEIQRALMAIDSAEFYLTKKQGK